MRPIDLFTEKQLTDARADQHVSKSVIQDSFNLAMLGMAPNQLTPRDMKEMRDILNQDSDSQRDKFALVSIAFCSPLMLLGMGATLAMTDDMKLNRVSKLEQSLQNRVQLQRNRVEATVESAERQRKLETAMQALDLSKFDRKPNPDPVETARKAAEREEKAQKVQKAEKALRAEKKLQQSEVAEKTIAVQKKPVDRIKFEKLMKEKQTLVDYLEQSRGKLTLKSASNLTARIEQIDRAIKKIL